MYLLILQLEQMRREAERQKEIAVGKVGPDGNPITRPETPMVGGYKECQNYALNEL